MKKTVKQIFLMALITTVSAFLLTGCSSNEENSSSEAPTPTISQEELKAEVDFENAEFVTGEDGEVLISMSPDGGTGTDGAALRSELSPDEVWENSSAALTGSDGFTLPEAVQLEDGSLGTLQIPAINLTVSVYETEDNELEAMVEGVAHFKETSCWDGNIGLAGHNQGVNTFFQDLYKLKNGDQIILTTALGTRTYEVSMSKEIDETDWSYLERTDNNRITLITCVNHDLTKRLCVQGVEVTD